MKELVYKAVDKTVTIVKPYISVAGQAQGFVAIATNLTNATNPVEAICGGVKLIASVCLPPNVKFPVQCGIFVAQLGIPVELAPSGVYYSHSRVVDRSWKKFQKMEYLKK